MYYSAAQNATTSPFLKLPPEIRQIIYGYVRGGRILHVASGPMLGPNRVVVCVNCGDFTNASDRQMIHSIRDGIVEVKNRGVTHSQLESHKECYQARETWSLNLLGVCRQIYHEGKHKFHHSILSSRELSLMTPSGPRTFQEERFRSGGWYHTRVRPPTFRQLPESPRPSSSQGHRPSHLAGAPNLRCQKTYARTPRGPSPFGVYTDRRRPLLRCSRLLVRVLRGAAYRP